jgi:hypothetical protein
MSEISVVYPLGTGSRLKDFEIRMSLRSIEKYLTGVKDVWIVGQCPPWLQNVNHIPFQDTHAVPDRNIMEKLKKACEHPEITEDFIMFNDDHFLLQPFDAPTFPYYHRNGLDEYVKRRGLDGYGRRSNNTLKRLQELRLPIQHFDVHTPIIYNKASFLEHVTGADWHKKQDGYIIKSLYANSLKIEGVDYKDNKINHPPKPDDLMFSTMPHMRATVTRFLQEQFPEASKYEKTGI